MDSTTLLSVVGGALVLSIIVLTSLCLNCKGNSQPKYITQHYQQPSQQPSQPNAGFTVIRPRSEHPMITTLPSGLQFITSPSLPDTRRISNCPSSDDGSQDDYVNQDDAPGNYEFPPEKNPDYPDYLDVLPEPHPSLPSLVSSANSDQSYENVPEENPSNSDDDDDDADSQPYINVENTVISFQTPVGSYESHSSDDQGSSDYVNAPNQVNTH